jgi:RNase P/RNase MRP subunit p29
MMKVIENAVVVGRSFGDNLVYTVMDELTGKTTTMLNHNNIDVIELGAEGMVSYETTNVVRMMSFESVMQEELA